ncbi:uncharacterized protein PV09_08843 [Verruconis gallopava]|uniref:Peptidase A1 domain-containing protein n=1 Tax=Verruconis gallopava TaxID=253628 RepID=A0A0D2AKM2_9PEZI|nr:uncharacterized protein PV09_08843 [Verruconis gallopava]KIV99543.1 hypothetical protein PV09_08843 [Verruconis gallopava]
MKNNSMYLCPVTIGGQKLMLDFDTCSRDLWVISSRPDQATQALFKSDGHTIYDPSRSHTATAAPGETWKIEYGDGSNASDDVANDTVTVGNIIIEAQAVEYTVKPKKLRTPVENMVSQGDIPPVYRLFAVCLSSWKDTDEPGQGKSFYTFGMIDQTVMKRCNATDFFWTPLVDQFRGFWEFPSKFFVVNGTTIPRKAAQKGGNSAIAGTTLALLDDETCVAIYKCIKGSRYDYQNQDYVFPSNTPERGLSSVGFYVCNRASFGPKESLLFAETEPGWSYGGIQSRGDLPFDILGDTSLKGIYAGKKRFGAVQHNLESQDLKLQ